VQLTGCKGLIRLYWTQLNSLTLNIFLSVGVTTTVFQHSSRQLVLPAILDLTLAFLHLHVLLGLWRGTLRLRIVILNNLVPHLGILDETRF